MDFQSFNFDVGYNSDSYRKIGVSERFGFGFMQRDTGYVSPLFGPEIYQVKKEYDLDDEEMVDLYMEGSVTYYPEEIEEFHGSVDLLYDGCVYSYKESATSEDGSEIVVLKKRGARTDNRAVVFNREDLDSYMESGEAIALWPLLKKAHR